MPAIGAAIIAFTQTITAAISGALSAIGGWSGISAFLASPFGSLILGIGLQLITSLFIKKPQAPSIEASKVNVRIAEPERWLSCGRNRQGGGVIFAEFDAAGNFWYVIVHCDSILTDNLNLYFDDEKIELDENGIVQSDNFCLTSGGSAYAGSGVKVPYFQVKTTTHTEDNPTPPPIDDLIAAFPEKWTIQHKLVGTTYSVIKVNPVAPANRYKVYRWRGPVGIGEPAFSIAGYWSNVYDPRDPDQILGDPETYKFSRNAALIWAWFRTHRYGRDKPIESINWDRIAEQANICDLLRTDIEGVSSANWLCDISVPESLERSSAEQQILMSCDAQLVFDDDGKCWPRVGYYYEPVLKLVRNRDIVAMESVEAQNGESLTQGVIVRYIEPDANFTTQPCAPYVNPFYYVEGETPKFLVVDALSIQNHRQAMTLAKSISHRSQSEHKLLPTIGLRGLRARQQRIIDLLYDNTFSGEYEISTTVEVDQNGAFVGFGCVPIDRDRWTLLAGEERPKPIVADSLTVIEPVLPSNVSLQFLDGQIRAYYDEPPRIDWYYEFEYQIKDGVTPPSDDLWFDMIDKPLENYAYVGGLVQNQDYHVRYQTTSTGGRSSGYIDIIPTVNTTTLTLTATPVLTGAVSVAYAGFTIGVTGGVAPYIYFDLYSRLPSGLTLDPATGAVSGTPDTAGVYSDIILRAQDDRGNSKNLDAFEITIT